MVAGQVEFSTFQIWVGRAAVLVMFAIAPFVNNQLYFIHVMGLAMIAAIAALGMQLLIGYSGQLSMGQAAFFGIGAYTSGILTKDYGVPFPVAFVAAGLMAAISSLALVPITRLRDVYLAVATLGFTVIVFLIFLNTEWLTGGSFGMMGIPRPSIGSISLSERGIYFLCFAVMVVIYFTFNRLVDSRFGRGLQAIMLDEDAAWSSGINVTLYKSKCFIIAAMVTGFAGSLFAAHSRYLNPDDFSFWKSIEILLMVAVGGIGSMTGAIVGAFVVVLLPEYLRAVDQWRLVIFGALLVLFMGLGKGGIAGFVSLTLGRVRTIFDRKNRRLPGRKGVSQ